MGRCCVIGCKNRPERKIPNITYHRFPKETSIQVSWIQATGRKNWHPDKNARICSKHFESRCFRKTKYMTFLNPNSIPTLFIIPERQDNSDTIEQPSTSKPLRLMEREDNSITIEQPSTSKPPGISGGTGELTEFPESLSMDNSANYGEQSSEHNLSGPVEVAMEIEISSVESNISCALPTIEMVETPRKQKLRRTLNKKTLLADKRKKKMATLRSRAWRLKNKTAELSSIIEQLKSRSMINEESADVLSSIDSANKDFLKRFICKETVQRKYSAELRKFALTLHFISPRAYDYVRKHFNTCLPHPRTLSRWYQCVDGNPGLSKESFEAVRLLNKANSKKNPSRKLLCALGFDEMAIRKFVHFDGKDCVGFVDCGNNINSGQLAKEALVFMLTCVNGSWKIPLGYFLINGISADQKANLVKTCIEMVYDECGVDIISVTFDGCPTNFAMAKILGCKLHDADVDPSFCIGDKKVVIFPDPSHMLKLVRNTLAQKGPITDGQGRTISWEYIKLLVELQENEGLHLGNKLTRAHENFTKQIMKVKLAAQTFSNSVADAIEFCTNELHIDGFQNSAATVEFIRKINDLFDLLNSRNMNAYAFKKPLYKGNYQRHKKFLEEMFEYLTHLKLGGRPLLNTNRKTGFWGFLICIKSICYLYETHTSSDSLRFICTYKFSQDHLEYFFSAIRAKGGFNNNPTAKQFKSAFKRMLVHGELKHITTGNCIPLQEINILTYTRPEVAINKTTDRIKLIDSNNSENDNFCCGEDIICTMEDHDYITDPSKLTEFSQQVVIYIAGFVVNKLEKELKCSKCVSALITEKYNSLQFKKDKGGLYYPSKDVVAICEISEKMFRQNKQISKKNNFHILSQECLKKCLTVDLFSQITEHFKNQAFLDCHYPLLIKSICLKYLKVRMHYATKKISTNDEKVRNFYNKLILFKGQ